MTSEMLLPHLSPRGESQRRTKILLVDDKPENLTALEAVLEGLGQDMIKAQSGKEALRHLLDHEFACILLDVMMPEMSGLETAAMIRERESSRNTPIIFLTALKSEEELFRGYFIGAVDYLFKPIVPDVLRSKVGVFVELAKHKQLLKEHAESLERANRELRQVIDLRRQAEEEVRRLNAELEDRVKVRTAELSAVNEELRQFAYIASHDLQEPLRTIGSYAQLLERRYKGKLEGDADEFISYLVDGVVRMHVLLNDMLTYSRVTDANAKPMQPVAAGTAVANALKNLQTAIQEAGADVTYSDLPTVVADEVQLSQVFQNLVGNAIKYRSTDAPKIDIRAEQTDGLWTFSVTDNGMGIDTKYRERIFGIFKRLHGKELPGTGMGLAICKKIIERHGGRIWVDQNPAGGSVFRFTIPVAAGQASTTAAAKPV